MRHIGKTTITPDASPRSSAQRAGEDQRRRSAESPQTSEAIAGWLDHDKRRKQLLFGALGEHSGKLSMAFFDTIRKKAKVDDASGKPDNEHKRPEVTITSNQNSSASRR